MAEMEQALEGILSNPDAMQKIMAIAQSLNQPAPPPPPEAPSPPPAQERPALPQGLDLTMLQKLSSFQGQNSIDKNQRTLLSALSPYLSRQRLSKLEKAMQAAKMAQFASSMLGGSQFNSGR